MDKSAAVLAVERHGHREGHAHDRRMNSRLQHQQPHGHADKDVRRDAAHLQPVEHDEEEHRNSSESQRGQGQLCRIEEGDDDDGAEIIESDGRIAYRIGAQQLNVHGPGIRAAAVARVPVVPGNSDLCFEWEGPIADAVAHLGQHGVAVELGPIVRSGAGGPGMSIYFRDPDGSLLEFISYRG